MARILRSALAAALLLVFSLNALATPGSETPRRKAPEVRQERDVQRRSPSRARRAKARASRPAPGASAAATVAPAPAQAGLVIAWDPESRTFGAPSAEQRLLLAPSEERALSRSFDGLVQVRHPDGSVSVDLQGRFREFAVVRLGPGGRPILGCVDDTASARRALAPPAPAPSAVEVR